MVRPVNYINPTIIEERKFNVASMDVFGRLMMDRIIFLGVPIDDESASIIIAQMLYLSSIDDKAPINLYINSPGGIITSGFGIYDTMQLIKAPVHTYCVGMAASFASLLLMAGDKRYALPHSKILIHQPLGGVEGQASDILIAAKEIEKDRDEICQVISKHTNQPFEKVILDVDRDYWMTAQEAVEYGIVDKIL